MEKLKKKIVRMNREFNFLLKPISKKGGGVLASRRAFI
jgi:hypothetical protein